MFGLSEDADDTTHVYYGKIFWPFKLSLQPEWACLFLVYSCLLLSTSKLVFVYLAPLDVAQLNV